MESAYFFGQTERLGRTALDWRFEQSKNVEHCCEIVGAFAEEAIDSD
jgi:hypothetical protein